MSSSPVESQRGLRVAILVSAFTALVVSLLVSGVLTGADARIVDTDGFMRMSRIAELQSGDSGWWDSVASRSNAPFGHSMHWTRPLDALVLVMALPLQLFFDSERALRSAGLMVGPLVFASVAGTMAWAAFPLVGRVGAVVAGLGVALQPTLLAYGSVGRVDHHGLIFLTTAALLGLGVRLAQHPSTTRAAAAGMVAAAGVWVSTELLLPIALFLMVFLVAWVVAGVPTAGVLRTFALWWAGGSVLALVVERAPDMLSSRDLDRVSAVHLLVAVLAATFWTLVGVATTKRWQPRALLATGAGAVTAAVLWLVVPSFVAGPFGDVPPALWDAWLSRVAELQPLWPFGANLARTVYLLTAPVIGVALAWRAGILDRPHRMVWWGLAAVIAGLVVLGVAQARFTAFSQLLATIAWGWLAATLVARVVDRRGLGGSLLRVGSMVAGVAGFLIPVILLALLSDTGPKSGAVADCDLDDVVVFLNDFGGKPVVLTHIDWGPEILYRTDASVLASPYHRNVGGILDARRFLASPPEEARVIADARSVSVVAVCPDRDAAYLGDDREAGDMLELVASGRPPEWLVSLPADSDLLVFTIAR
jgi:hypothetical protein